MGQLINFEDLQVWTGINQSALLTRWLEKSNIRYWLNHNGKPITTVQDIRGDVEDEAEKLEFYDR